MGGFYGAPQGPAPPGYYENDYVPPYAPPQGSSKVDPDQRYSSVQTQGLASPAGPAGAGELAVPAPARTAN
jgi:hypothetical protein